MREVRPGTLLLNAKGKEVKVTNVYFSRESTVMVQISAHCHATITHPMVDTKGHRRWNRGRRISAKTIVTAAEWYTCRRHNIYRSTPMGSPPLQPLDHQVGHYLHPSSPQNLHKSGDMWGFSTEHNQPVRSFDDHRVIWPDLPHRPHRLGTSRHSHDNLELLGEDKTPAGSQTQPD